MGWTGGSYAGLRFRLDRVVKMVSFGGVEEAGSNGKITSSSFQGRHGKDGMGVVKEMPGHVESMWRWSYRNERYVFM